MLHDRGKALTKTISYKKPEKETLRTKFFFRRILGFACRCLTLLVLERA